MRPCESFFRRATGIEPGAVIFARRDGDRPWRMGGDRSWRCSGVLAWTGRDDRKNTEWKRKKQGQNGKEGRQSARTARLRTELMIRPTTMVDCSWEQCNSRMGKL